jgi:WD40 repeat protein
MEKMAKTELTKATGIKYSRFVFAVILSVYIMTIILSILVSACSSDKKTINNQNQPYAVITPENAGSVAFLDALTDHTDQVWTVAFSPDGKLLASCG